MRINEIITESYADDLVTAVQDIMSFVIAKDMKSISTEKFKSLLTKQGYVVSTDELIAAVDASGFANSVDAEKIVPTDQMGDIEAQDEPTVDVGKLAGQQAMRDVKTGL